MLSKDNSDWPSYLLQLHSHYRHTTDERLNILWWAKRPLRWYPSHEALELLAIEEDRVFLVTQSKYGRINRRDGKSEQKLRLFRQASEIM